MKISILKILFFIRIHPNLRTDVADSERRLRVSLEKSHAETAQLKASLEKSHADSTAQLKADIAALTALVMQSLKDGGR